MGGILSCTRFLYLYPKPIRNLPGRKDTTAAVKAGINEAFFLFPTIRWMAKYIPSEYFSG
jgi:hypothetical protein